MKRIILGLPGLALMLTGAMAAPKMVMAAKDICLDGSIPEDILEAAGCETKKQAPAVVKSLINVVLGLIGLIAVIVIIYAGVTLSMSSGDAMKVARAKNMIIFGVLGLIVALLAFAIVNFALTSVFELKDSSTTTP